MQKKNKSMKTFVIGDPHGGLRAIQQCFERSGIDKDNDRLICVGDVADGWTEAAESLEELLTVKNLYYVLGNHDFWLLEYLKYGRAPHIWLSQGGKATLSSYENNPDLVAKHRDFYEKAPYYLVLDGNLYVHGGFNALMPIDEQDGHELMWDRDMWYRANAIDRMSNTAKVGRSIKMSMSHINDYKKIFIGHTSTSQVSQVPIQALNIWNVDQGGGWEGFLTIMDVDTEEFWQSDRVSDLYPGVKGRG